VKAVEHANICILFGVASRSVARQPGASLRHGDPGRDGKRPGPKGEEGHRRGARQPSSFLSRGLTASAMPDDYEEKYLALRDENTALKKKKNEQEATIKRYQRTA
jgi:hypothetical protein